MPLVNGLQLSTGVQPVNPVAVDAWSGPYISTTEALASIPKAVRFQTMEVRVIDSGIGKKYWFKNGNGQDRPGVNGDTDLVEFVSGSSGNFIPTTEKGAASGVATLDASGFVPASQLNISALTWKGGYNATTNVPSLINGTGTSGDVYRVTVAGTRNFGAGNIVLAISDYVIYNDSGVYEKFVQPATITFLNLIDVPNSYAGQGGKAVRVNTSETGLEFSNFTGGVLQFALYTGFPTSGDPNILYVDKSTNDGWYWDVSSYKLLGSFTADFTVSLANSKTLGKYTTGQTVSAIGKSAKQILLQAAIEALAPSGSLNSSTSILFNQTSISNVLNYSYTINSLGATVATTNLEWRRNNTGSWISLSTNASLSTFTHTLTDSAFNTQSFNYRYTVTDSAGGTNIFYKDITPQSYVAPSVSFSAPATSVISPENNQLREKGNISSVLQGTIVKNSSLTTLLSYQLYYSLNGGSPVPIGSSVSISGTTVTISPVTHNDSALIAANTITYTVVVTDSFSNSGIGSYAISFDFMVFYGATFSVPTTSANIRGLDYKRFYGNGGTFILPTGAAYLNFTVSVPVDKTLTNAIDTTALNAPITGEYVSATTTGIGGLNTFPVKNAGMVDQSYHNYTMHISTPYSTSHNHSITLS